VLYSRLAFPEMCNSDKRTSLLLRDKINSKKFFLTLGTFDTISLNVSQKQVVVSSTISWVVTHKTSYGLLTIFLKVDRSSIV
jgi:hypothetical protein